MRKVALTVGLCLAATLPTAWASSPGPTQWVRTYEGPAGAAEVAGLAVSPDSRRVFVTGTTFGPANSLDIRTVAYTSDGSTKLWATRFNGGFHLNDVATDIRTSPDGSAVFVTGYGYTSLATTDFVTVAYDAGSGAELWSRRFGSISEYDEAHTLSVDQDGSRLFVSGVTWDVNGTDVRTIAYDAASGSRLWSRRYDGPAHGEDLASAAAVASDGSVLFVTGTSAGATTSTNARTIAYDAATGSLLWTRRFDGESDEDRGEAVVASPDGSAVFVSISSKTSASHFDYVTRAYDAATGSRLWTARYNGPGNSVDQPRAIAIAPGGSSVFVTGRSLKSGGVNYDYATVAYDAQTGSSLWTKRYNGTYDGVDEAVDVDVSPGGSTVYVTGTSVGIVQLASTYEDIATPAYDATTGQRLGVRRYHSKVCDFRELGRGLEVSPDGTKVFVAGLRHCPEANTAYVTIGYGA